MAIIVNCYSVSCVLWPYLKFPDWVPCGSSSSQQEHHSSVRPSQSSSDGPAGFCRASWLTLCRAPGSIAVQASLVSSEVRSAEQGPCSSLLPCCTALCAPSIQLQAPAILPSELALSLGPCVQGCVPVQCLEDPGFRVGEDVPR